FDGSWLDLRGGRGLGGARKGDLPHRHYDGSALFDRQDAVDLQAQRRREGIRFRPRLDGRLTQGLCTYGFLVAQRALDARHAIRSRLGCRVDDVSDLGEVVDRHAYYVRGRVAPDGGCATVGAVLIVGIEGIGQRFDVDTPAESLP